MKNVWIENYLDKIGNKVKFYDSCKPNNIHQLFTLDDYDDSKKENNQHRKMLTFLAPNKVIFKN